MTSAARARLDGWCAAGFLLALAAVFFPLATGDGGPTWLTPAWAGATVLLVLAVLGWSARRGVATSGQGLILLLLVSLGVGMILVLLHGRGLAGRGGPGLWLFVGALWLAAWRGIDSLAAVHSLDRTRQRAADLLVPTAFGLWLLFLWEVVTVGFGVPQVLLPSPGMIVARLAASPQILAADFHQTFVKAVLSGYVMGCGAGFLVSLLIDRVPFLQRGLLPLGNLVSALPIVGVAPIMVMWFGFDWPSKAAVVVIMTFFPMLVNTLTGLAAAGHLERDLMASYGAGYWPTLVKLRLPVAMPFIFKGDDP